MMASASSQMGQSRPSPSEPASHSKRSAKTTRQYYPICTSCAQPASSIYKSYTPTLIVLVRCSNPSCKHVVDAYGDEEYQPGTNTDKHGTKMSGSWMDLILVKPRAYRHFLYNLPFLLPAPGGTLELNHSERSAWQTICKRVVALSLVDGYLRWFYLCAYSSGASQVTRVEPPRYTLPYLVSAMVETVGHLVRPRGESTVEVLILRQMGMTELMVGSYLMVWIGTLLETAAMYAMVTVLSWIYVQLARRRKSRRSVIKQEKSRNVPARDDGATSHDALDLPGPIDVPPSNIDQLDLYRPSLIPNALLLSSLTTLLLLSIVLLWESKLPRPDTTSYRTPVSSLPPLRLDDVLPQWVATKVTSHVLSSTQVEDTIKTLGAAFSTDFAVRTLLGGLNAGVSLAVIHPKLPFLTTSLLLLGWLAAYNVRSRFTLLPSDVGPGGATAGGHRWSAEAEAAVGWYCAVCC